MSKQGASSKTTKNTKPLKPCLVFDLETTAFAAGQATYDLTAKLMKAHGITLTPEIFTRFNLSQPSAVAFSSMCAALGLNQNLAETLADEVNKDFSAAIIKAKPQSPVIKLLETAASQGLSIGALTALPETESSKLVELLALGFELTLLTLAPNNDKVHLRADAWTKLLQQMQVSPAQCVALVNSFLAFQAALTAGMRVVVLPDAYTSYMDFAGADLVLENPKSIDLNEILALTTPAAKK